MVAEAIAMAPWCRMVRSYLFAMFMNIALHCRVNRHCQSNSYASEFVSGKEEPLEQLKLEILGFLALPRDISRRKT